MRPEPPPLLDRYRCNKDPEFTSPAGEMYGAFLIPAKGEQLRVISSGRFGGPYEWEHVSVSLAKRTPTWSEMSFIKNLFWSEWETVVQFHVPKNEHVNFHPYCLHLWRHVSWCRDGVLLLPPTVLVGPKDEA